MNYYIGVMSGTSLDGIDITLTRFSLEGDFQLIAAQTYPFSRTLHDILQQLINKQTCHLQELGEADIALGRLIGQSINEFLETQKISAKDITAIGSHGQTLFHSPNSSLPFSLQIGNADVIAEITGITTVADFRQRDIAAGGQGAPLVPAFHQSLFKSAMENRIIVNIGGISNITILPISGAVIGFDTGPGNCLLDYWTQLHTKQPYDKSGMWAASGRSNNELLHHLLDEPYFRKNAPKSTGRELFNQNWLETKLTHVSQTFANEDVQATLTEFTAITIATDINRYAQDDSAVFICGGGAHNDYLLNRLQAYLSSNTVSTTEAIGLHPDWVESCAFAWLAYRRITNQTANLVDVTGASHSVMLGAIYSSSDASYSCEDNKASTSVLLSA